MATQKLTVKNMHILLMYILKILFSKLLTYGIKHVTYLSFYASVYFTVQEKMEALLSSEFLQISPFQLVLHLS